MLTDRVRILHIVPNLRIGGIQRFVLDIAYYQKDNPNVEIGIFVCNSNKPQWKDLAENLGIKLFWDNLGSLEFNPRRYKNFIDTKHSFDVIHWHFFHPALSFLTYFDDKVHLFTHHSVLGMGRISKKTDKLKWKLFKPFVNNRINCEVYNSEYTKKFWQDYGLHAPKNIVIYNGSKLNSQGIDIPQRTKNPEKFTIGTITNLIGWKRTYLLVEAFCEWAKDKDDVQLLVVGEGPERKRLENIVKENHAENKAIFTGHQNDVKPYRNKMDLCVFPSTTETFGLAALESLYDGIPVIAMADGGGICEVVGDSRNIVNNQLEMIKRFDFYYNLNPEDYTKESVQAFQRSLLFDMKDKAQDYIKLYLNIVNGKKI